VTGEWISVEDRLPPMREVYKGSPLTSGSVLIFTGYWVSVGVYEETYAKRKPRWQDEKLNRVTNVTHWMPLPEPPVKTPA
jgi:hypothetical protein